MGTQFPVHKAGTEAVCQEEAESGTQFPGDVTDHDKVRLAKCFELHRNSVPSKQG